MRGVTKHQNLKGWLNSKAPGSGSGSRARNLTGWKDMKTGKGQVDTFLHTKCLPMTVWRHPFPIVVTVRDRQTREEVTHVWTRNHTCHETESVLSEMYFREVKGDPSSPRKTPPERCALCKLAEWCWQQSWAWIGTHDWVVKKTDDGRKTGRWVEGVFDDEGNFSPKKGAGRGVDPCAVLFQFTSEASDDENKTIHVGGYCGLFGRDEIPDSLVKAMAAAKIYAKDAWREKGMVKPMSVMCVVDNAKPELGVQISEETKELGEKVKEQILKVLDGSDIDIQKSPYCIRWEYDRSKNMNQQYSATPMMKIKPDARILAAVRGEVPDLSQIETPFNQTELRAVAERFCKLADVPWSEIFPTKKQEEQWAREDAANRDSDDDDADDVDAETDEEDDAVAADDDGDEEMVACDACKKPHPISASACPHCGHEYDVEDDAEPEEEKPKVRTRAEANGGKKKAVKPPPAESGTIVDDDGDQDDELPF